MQFFAWPIFRQTYLILRPQKRGKEVESGGHYFFLELFSSLVSKYAIHRNCLGDLYLWCEGRFLKIDPPPIAPTSLPPIHFCTPAALTSRLFNQAKARLTKPWLASDEARRSLESNSPDVGRLCFLIRPRFSSEVTNFMFRFWLTILTVSTERHPRFSANTNAFKVKKRKQEKRDKTLDLGHEDMKFLRIFG